MAMLNNQRVRIFKPFPGIGIHEPFQQTKHMETQLKFMAPLRHQPLDLWAYGRITKTNDQVGPVTNFVDG